MAHYPGEPGYSSLRSGHLDAEGRRREIASSRSSIELYPRTMPLDQIVEDLIGRSLITDQEIADYWLGTDPASSLELGHKRGTCLPLCRSCALYLELTHAGR